MGYLEAVEARIQDAVAAGHFSGLPGEGRPLPFKPEENLAGDNWIGFKVLQNGGMLPDWLNQGRQLERDQLALKEIDRRHAEVAARALTVEDWTIAWPVLLQLREQYEQRAIALRRAQEQFNWDAPGRRTQRPPIWVEYHLERLDSRLASPIDSAPRAS